MTINDQIRHQKLQYDINREAAKISSLSSGKIHKYEYLTYPLGKAFEKQIKTIEDQGKKQIDALERLKPKKETKPIESKPNNQSRAAIIFNELISKRKGLMKELYDGGDYNNLKFDFIGPTKDVSFYEYKDSKELFSVIKDNKINYDYAVKRQNELLNKISTVKIGKKTNNQKEVINNLENVYKSRESLLIFLETMEKWSLMQPTDQNKMKQGEKGLKY